MARERRREHEELERPTAISNNTRWATRGGNITVGSRVFDEVFRIGIGAPAGAALAYLLADAEGVAEREDGLAALGAIVVVFGVASCLSVLAAIVWGFWRKADLQKRRRRREALPQPMRALGSISFACGILGYLLWRATA